MAETILEENSTLIGEAKALAEQLPDVGGGSGTDISLGVTGASVGDIIKVKAVDASGKPTAWEAENQQAIVDDVLAALPTWEGGSY